MIDLDSLKKEEHYEVPEGYFDQLPQQVMSSIRKSRNRRRTTWLSAVAAVMLGVVCTTIILKVNEEEGAPAAKQSTEIQDEKQLEEQIRDYYSEEFAQMDYYNY